MKQSVSAVSTGVPKAEHRIGITIRVDYESLVKIDKIALFEHEDRAVWGRRMLMEKIQVYERNPAFKRFLKQLEEAKKDE